MDCSKCVESILVDGVYVPSNGACSICLANEEQKDQEEST